MPTVIRRSLTAAAAVALAAPLTFVAISNAQAAEAGFTTVAPALGVDLVSPVDGVAYVSSGTDLTRWTRDGSSTRVTLPVAASGPMDLATYGGKTYLLTGTAVVTVEDTTTSQIPLPAKIAAPMAGMPSPEYDFTATSIAADAKGLWITGTIPAGYPMAVILHWDGTQWTRVATDTDSGPRSNPATDIVRVDGVSDVSKANGSYSSRDTKVMRWDGAAFTALPGTSGFSNPSGYETLAKVTYASANDYTAWGSKGSDSISPVPATGTCRHTVATVTTDCAAPAWPVSAAVRLGDGRVVLGGSNGTSTIASAVHGGFAVVDAPGATPADIPGENDERVRLLAAAPTGSTVWAMTTTTTGSLLKVADLSATTAPTTAPTVAPSTTAPTTPAPTTSAPSTTPAPTATTSAPTAAPTTTPTTSTPTTTPTTSTPTTSAPTTTPTTSTPTAAPTHTWYVRLPLTTWFRQLFRTIFG